MTQLGCWGDAVLRLACISKPGQILGQMTQLGDAVLRLAHISKPGQMLGQKTRHLIALARMRSRIQTDQGYGPEYY
jgi:hypothetical protein